MCNSSTQRHQDYEEYRKFNKTRWPWRGYEIRVRNFGTKVGTGFNIYCNGEFIVDVIGPMYTESTDAMRYIDYHLDREWRVAQSPKGCEAYVI